MFSHTVPGQEAKESNDHKLNLCPLLCQFHHLLLAPYPEGTARDWSKHQPVWPQNWQQGDKWRCLWDSGQSLRCLRRRSLLVIGIHMPKANTHWSTEKSSSVHFGRVEAGHEEQQSSQGKGYRWELPCLSSQEPANSSVGQIAKPGFLCVALAPMEHAL